MRRHEHRITQKLLQRKHALFSDFACETLCAATLAPPWVCVHLCDRGDAVARARHGDDGRDLGPLPVFADLVYPELSVGDE